MLTTRVASHTQSSSELIEQVHASKLVTVLQSQNDIERLLKRSRKLFIPLRVHRIKVSLDGLSDKDLNDTEIRLNAKLHECGCQEGGIAGALSLSVYVALLFYQVGWPTAWHWKHVGFGIAFCFAMAMLGKGIGLLRTRLRLIQELELLWRLSQIRKPLNTGE